jgi:hypothetical protein
VRLNNSHIYNRAYVNQLQYDGSKDMPELKLFLATWQSGAGDCDAKG